MTEKEIEEILKKNTTWVSELELETNTKALSLLIKRKQKEALVGLRLKVNERIEAVEAEELKPNYNGIWLDELESRIKFLSEDRKDINE